MMVMVMVMAAWPDHDPRNEAAIGVMMVMMMMVATHYDKLRHFQVR